MDFAAMRSTREPRELVEAVLYKFEAQGDTVTGKLASIETANVGGKETPKFVFDDGSGGQFFIWGTQDLQKKIRRAHIGLILEITYREDKWIEGQENKMRVFKVMAL